MGRNIVLCSDGTGNHGGKGRGTNVWRLYKALDLADPEQQIAFYDDGVGTENFSLLRVIGGAFGWGLARNVRQLYTFLVRHYHPGDNIYLFGFSRGAFTVRVLAGFIEKCGLLAPDTYQSESALHKKVKEAYKVYRKVHKGRPEAEEFKKKNGIRYLLLGKETQDIPIKFVGVWDTVDAVGIPMDELRDAIDILAHNRFIDLTLSPLVERACHALAIDDARMTFHPVMWDEKNSKNPERIEQVWFAGMHSNVGGGYPKDEMSFVPLDWMMSRADGLVYLKGVHSEYRKQANVNGKLHDSRSGMAAYYRYNPRDIGEIGSRYGSIGAPTRVHASIFERIAQGTDAYAPVNLPREMKIIKSVAGPIVGVDFIRPSDDAERFPDVLREQLFDHAWNVIWIRRGLYFLLLVVTWLFVVLSFQGAPGTTEYIPDSRLLEPLFDAIIAFTPDILANRIIAFRVNTYAFTFIIVAFGLLFIWRSRLKRAVGDIANCAWSLNIRNRRPEANPDVVLKNIPWFSGLAGLIRKSEVRKRTAHGFKMLAAWVTFIGVPIIGLWFGFNYLKDVDVNIYKTKIETTGYRSLLNKPRTVHFNTKEPCQRTNILLEKGKRYDFSVQLTSPWLDEGIPAGPNGFRRIEDGRMLFWAVPVRRAWRQDWFKLMGSIDCTGGNQFVIGAGIKDQLIDRTGYLHLFVNDAVCYLCPEGPWYRFQTNFWYFYENNQGAADITVMPRKG